MYIKVGSYQGVSGNKTVDIGFVPKIVIVKTGSLYAVFKTPDMANAIAAYLANGAINYNAITFSGNTFIASSGVNEVNSNGVWHEYIAYGDNGENDIDWGTYNFSSVVDGRSIADCNFQPDIVVIKGDSTTSARWRSSGQVGDLALTFGAVYANPDLIQSFISNGFTIGAGAAVQTINITYFWFALKKAAGKIYVHGGRTGNTSDDLAVTGIGFPPSCVLIKSDLNSGTGYNAAIRFLGNGYNESLQITNAVPQDNAIQNFLADGFELGTRGSVNLTNITYTDICFNQVLPVADSQPCFLEGSVFTPLTSNPQPCYLNGYDTKLDSQPCYIAVEIPWMIESQLAFINGYETKVDSQPCYLEGYNSTAFDYQDSQSCYLEGVDGAIDSQPAFIDGYETKIDSQPAYTNGYETKIDSQPAFINSYADKTDSQPAYISSYDLKIDSQPVFVHGEIEHTDDNQPCYLNSYANKVDSQPIFVNGYDTKLDSQPCYLEGHYIKIDNQPAHIVSSEPLIDLQLCFIEGSNYHIDQQSCFIAGADSTEDSQHCFISAFAGLPDSLPCYIVASKQYITIGEIEISEFMTLELSAEDGEIA